MQPASGAETDNRARRSTAFASLQNAHRSAARRPGLMARCKAGGAFCAKAFGSAQRRLEQLSGANDVSRLDMVLVRSSGAVAARGDDWRTPLWAGLNTLVFPLLLVGATTVVLLLAVRFSPFEFNSILY